MSDTDTAALARRIASHRGRLAIATRYDDADAQYDAKRALAAAKIAAHAEKVLADAPPLTDEQADEIVAIIGRHSVKGAVA